MKRFVVFIVIAAIMGGSSYFSHAASLGYDGYDQKVHLLEPAVQEN